MTNSVSEWQIKFTDVTSQLVDELLASAKQCDTYGEATSFIKKLSSKAYGTADDGKALATMKLNDAICDCALHELYKEERSLPIRRDDDAEVRDS